MDKKTLKSKRLILVPPIEEDNEAYEKIIKNKNLREYKVYSSKFFNSMIKNNSKAKYFAWIIKDIKTNEIIGALRIEKVTPKHPCCSIDYEIGFDFLDKGYAVEALKTVINYAYDELNIKRIETWIHSNNKAAEKVLLKSGFIYEGTLRQRVLYKGRPADQAFYGLLITDKIEE